MVKYARRYFYFVMAGLTYLIVHEGVHIMQAKMFGVYKGIRLLPLGIEVMIIPIGGLKLAAFSGLSSVATLVIGYALFALSPRILKLNKQPVKNYIYYVTFLFLVLDPVYLSLLSFFVGGDINGIALGLDMPYMVIRGVCFIIAVFNTYLVSRKLYPAYVIK